MAESKQDRKTFTWGDRTILVDDIIGKDTPYRTSFYNFAKERGQFDDKALQQLGQAIDAEMDAIKAGEAFDADGSRSANKVNNISIQTQKKGLFKKDKYVDQDITEWAKYYLSKLMGDVREYTPEGSKETSKSWDATKHGLGAYLTGQGLSGKDIFEKYDLKDASNPNAARSFSQRRELLKQHLAGYGEWLKNKNFDFSKNDNEWDDNYVADFNKFVTDFDSLDNTALTAALRKFGAGDAYTTAFTSDRWELDKTASQTEEDIKAEAERKQKEAEDKLKQDRLREWEDYAYANRKPSTVNYYKPFNYGDSKYNGKFSDFRSWYGDLNDAEKQHFGTYLGIDSEAWNNAWNTFTESLRSGVAYADKNAGVLLQGAFENQPHLFTDLGDGNYLIKGSVTGTGQGTIYNPQTGYTGSVFLGDLATSNEAIKNEYRRLANEYIKGKYNVDYTDRTYVLQEGGNLPKPYQENVVNFNWDTTDEVYQPKAVKNNISVQTQRAKDQYLDSDNKSLDNPNAGWDAKHYARLGAAVGDLTAAIAGFFPGAGTITAGVAGFGSTGVNFFTDLSDDAVTAGEMWKNLGLNLGMDIIGLIPGGGAASKMGKIVKTLKTTAPLIIALPGVVDLFNRTPEIAQSWKKAFDGNSKNGGSKMNYQDYMNILQVLNVAAGATNIGTGLYKTSKASQKQSNKIAVDVVDKHTKQRKALLLEGDDVTKFKQAQSEGKSQEFLNTIEGGNDFIINETSSFNKGKFWGRDGDSNFELFHQNPLGVTKTGKSKTLTVRSDLDGKLYADTGAFGGADLIDADLVNMSNRRTLSQFTEHHQTKVDGYIKRLREQAKAYGDKTAKHKQHLEAATQRITDTEAAIRNNDRAYATQETLFNNNNQLVANIEAQRAGTGLGDAQTAITNARQKIAQKTAEKETIKGNSRQAKARRDAIDAEIGELQEKIGTHERYIAANSEEMLVAARTAASTAETKMNNLQIETAKLNRLLRRLRPHKSNLETRVNTHSTAFNRLKRFKPVKRKFNDVEYTFGQALEESAMLNDGLFKDGGTINKTKITKYLNYAKG